MKYLDAYRDPQTARALLEQIARSASRPWSLLEVCGGQAHNLVRFGIDRDLPPGLELVHGPACPVCALPAVTVDRAVAIAGRAGVIVAAPGDLLRVPGGRGRETLLEARGRGADVRAVYSPLDALALARKHPDREVVVITAGFETTAPAAAAAVVEAERLGLANLSLLCAFFRLAPAVASLLAAADDLGSAVLVAGPACAVTGLREFETLAERFRTPVIVTGPEPVDLLDAIARAVRQLEAGTYKVENQYDRAVRPDGNPQVRAAISAAFEPADASWRGLGMLPASGLILRERFRRFDASARYSEAARPPSAPADCPDADLISGRLKPLGCPAFGTRCTPEHPLGPFMVSAEGVCAAFHRYRRSPDHDPPSSTLSVIPASAVPGA
jgi:hydrogenase expression/formation protein HypD